MFSPVEKLSTKAGSCISVRCSDPKSNRETQRSCRHNILSNPVSEMNRTPLSRDALASLACKAIGRCYCLDEEFPRPTKAASCVRPRQQPSGKQSKSAPLCSSPIRHPSGRQPQNLPPRPARVYISRHPHNATSEARPSKN
jgi:hypothetical protein